ncbi:MAG: hypothetical protein JST82_16105 [Bacteroidetes bacterium]|nr:hypothetical protein [Bacteroidota bacterium]
MTLSISPQLLLSAPSGAEFLVVLTIIGIFLLPCIFYLITLQNTLKAISFENRQMQPGNVWLLLIPVFNIVWQFILVSKVSQSIELECKKRNIPCEPQPAYTVGLVFCIANCVSWIPLLGWIAGLAGLVCWILHWVKVAEYKNKFLVQI